MTKFDTLRAALIASAAATVTINRTELRDLLAQFDKLAAKPVKKAKAVAVVLPAWLPVEAWNEFLGMREKMKKPATPYAQTLLIKQLTAWYADDLDVSVILNQSIMNNWQGLFAPKVEARGYGYDTGPRKPFGARPAPTDVNAANNAIALALLDQSAGDNARLINE